MRKRLSFILIFLAILAFSIVGLTRLRFETNVLEVLPKNLPSVEALKISQKYFNNDQQLVLLLESQTEEIDEEDIAELTTLLREKLAPIQVLYKSELEENPAASARALAELWRDAPPEDVETLSQRLLDPSALAAHLATVKEQVGSSFDQQQSTMAAYDPLGFLGHPAVRQFLESELSFQSEDGKSQIILIGNPNPGNGYKEQAAWIQQVRDVTNSWSGLKELGLTFRLTGGPAFNAEIGAGMEKDMSGTIILTSVMIGLLFLLIQRHIGHLLVTLASLKLTFLITLGLAGWVYGTLNLVSVGFAGILLGLVIDYSVVIARASVGEKFTASSLRRLMGPGIFWAASTTVIVFAGLILSSFTGVRQLGGLILIGLMSGAAVTLTFTPMFLERFPYKKPSHLLKPPFPGFKVGLGIVATCLITASTVFLVKGPPKVNFDFATMEPSKSEAAATFATIQKSFSAWSENNIQMIATAGSWEELRKVAKGAAGNLKELREKGMIEHYQWPLALIPDEQAGEQNRPTLTKIAAARPEILATMKANGFSDSGVALDNMILEALAGPSHPKDLDILAKHFLVGSDDGHYHLAGMVKTTRVITDQTIADLAPLRTTQCTITGWSILKSELLPSVKRDFYWIVLPTAVVLFLSLILIFRSMKDALIASTVLLTVVALLNALSVATGQPWNFLSGMAIPIIFGSGVDYSIYLIFALRRSNGDLAYVWNGAAKAICFCGGSTAIGFGSLAFASNEMLRSMGLMCGAAVALATVLSVILVPGLWKWSRR